MEIIDLKTSTVLMLGSLLAIACGNDDSSVQSEISPLDSQPSGSAPLDDQVIKSGRFLDSAVMGLAYSTPTQHGFTDIEGTYRYLDGESVAFYLGDPQLPGNQAWKLGDITAREIITPLELLGTDIVNQQVKNLLRILQSLDVDGDPANGIELPADGTILPDGNLLLDLSLSDTEFEVDPVINSYLAHALVTGELVSEQNAVDHFQTTLNELLDIPVGRWIYTHGTIDGVAISDLTASIQVENDTHYSAQYSWHGDSGFVSAGYSITGMNFGSEVDVLQLNSGAAEIYQFPNDTTLNNTLQSLPESTHEFVNVVLAVDANLRLLPNSIVLESEDGNVVLHYTRGETTSDGTIAYLEINSPNVISSVVGDLLQLEAVAHASSSAIIFPAQFSWSSSDPTVATVNNNGQVTAVGNGSATIQASAAGINVSVQIEVSTEYIAATNNDANVANEEVPSAANDPGKCPDGQVLAQSNEENVSQHNVSTVNQTSIAQSNQQSVVQENSGDRCVPAAILNVDVPVSGF